MSLDSACTGTGAVDRYCIGKSHFSGCDNYYCSDLIYRGAPEFDA